MNTATATRHPSGLRELAPATMTRPRAMHGRASGASTRARCPRSTHKPVALWSAKACLRPRAGGLPPRRRPPNARAGRGLPRETKASRHADASVRRQSGGKPPHSKRRAAFPRHQFPPSRRGATEAMRPRLPLVTKLCLIMPMPSKLHFDRGLHAHRGRREWASKRSFWDKCVPKCNLGTRRRPGAFVVQASSLRKVAQTILSVPGKPHDPAYTKNAKRNDVRRHDGPRHPEGSRRLEARTTMPARRRPWHGRPARGRGRATGTSNVSMNTKARST